MKNPKVIYSLPLTLFLDSVHWRFEINCRKKSIKFYIGFPFHWKFHCLSSFFVFRIIIRYLCEQKRDLENPLTAFSQAFFTRHAIADDAFPSVERGRVTHNLNAAHPRIFQISFPTNLAHFSLFFLLSSLRNQKKWACIRRALLSVASQMAIIQ